ncbi:MAG: glycogen debranching N-terminal domain-containing protein [Candidatus Sericytochromatia bacterium]
MATSDRPFEIPAALPILGTDLPVDVELTGRVGAAPPAIAPSCAHTRQAIKHGDTFVVAHTDGEIHPGCECGQGVYHRDTRFLSGLTLAIAGKAPIVLSTSADHNFFSRVEAMNEAFDHPGQPPVKRETMHVGRTRLIDGGVRERIEIRNYNPFDVTTTVTLELRADFKDIFEVRGFFAKAAQGTFLRPRLRGAGAELLYRGADNVVRHTDVAFDAPPERLSAHTWADTHETGVRAEWTITVPGRGGEWALELTVTPRQDGVGGTTDPHEPVGLARLEWLHARAESGMTRIQAAHPGFDAFINRGVADLLMLATPTADGPIVAAGIPWYTCPFGRDSILTAIQSLPLGPHMAEATLRFLARHQGDNIDPFRDEEPGKILHEMREGEMSVLGEVPFDTYYGTIDATPLWLVLLSETFRWTGDRALLEAMWPHALRALSWIDTYGDADGDGFVEYQMKGERGLLNQGWKDSNDSVIHPDCTLADYPIALAEVQGYVYDAKRRTAELARLLGHLSLAERLEAQADELKRRFHEAFWVEEGGFYAIALDGRKRQVRTKTSNPGHCLWSGLIEPDRIGEVAKGLIAPDMFNGWGIRTMSQDSPAYNPLSYHNGTIWPHDNSLIVKGLADSGHKAEANTVMEGLYQTSRHFDYHRLPELFCGFERNGRFAKPVPYPVACSPQAWAAGTPILLLQAALGLEADAPRGVLRVVRPELPAWIGQVSLHGLRVGAGEVDLAFFQINGRTACTVVGHRGELRVEVVA